MVEAAATVFKGHLLIPSEELCAHRLKHLRLHQCLAQPRGFQPRHLAGTKHHVLHQVTENGVHCVGAGEAVGVDTQVLSPTANLDLSPQRSDDVLPQVCGTEWAREP